MNFILVFYLVTGLSVSPNLVAPAIVKFQSMTACTKAAKIMLEDSTGAGLCINQNTGDVDRVISKTN